MASELILIYESKCPKCRFLSKLVYLFDIRGVFSFLPIRSRKAVSLLHEFYDHPSYNFYFIDDDRNLCYSGLKAVPAILLNLMKGIFWPFGGKGPDWLTVRK